MTYPRQGQPFTAMALLGGTGEKSPAEHVLVSALRSNPRALAGIPDVVRTVAMTAVATAAVGLLGFSLIELVVDGWREHRDLTAAARRTLARPGSTELVKLATHEITVIRRPYISVLVNGEDVATVEFDLTLTFVISVMVAGVSAGRLTALHSGRCDATAELAIQGAEVLNRQAELDLPGAISLGGGIRLLPEKDFLAVPPTVRGAKDRIAEETPLRTPAEQTAVAAAQVDSPPTPAPTIPLPRLRPDRRTPP
jgi:hypothetical protein